MSTLEVASISEYASQTATQSAASVASASNRDKVSPGTQLASVTRTTASTTAQNSLANNPIISGGVDIINKTVTTTTQSLAASLVNTATGGLKPLQSAADAYFTTLALVSVSTVEIPMALARGNANLIVTKLKQKEAIVTQIRAEAIALYNSVITMLNSQPYFTAYFNKLLTAYNDILIANKDLKSVAAALKTQNPFYNGTLFNQAMSLLNQAEGLLLPGTGTTTNIRTGQVNAAQNSVASPQQAQLTAMAIAAISAKIAELMVQYALLTEEANNLISLFLTAFSSFIAAYKRSPTVDQATVNHITSATGQLDSLLASMQVQLFPTQAQSANPLYPMQVTANATAWGVKLAAIIAWLNANPGAGSAILDTTSDSIAKYNQAIALLNGQGSIKYNTATLNVTASQEDVLDTGTQVAHVLFDANTVVITKKNPINIQAEMQQFLDLLSAAHELDTNIINALTPFINTPNELAVGAASIVSNLSSAARGLGFDRVADLIGKGDIASLFSVSAATATYVGAALVGVRGIMGVVNSSPNATDQDKATLAAVDTSMSSQNAVKQVEATRSATDSTGTFTAQVNAATSAISKQCNAAIQIAQKYNPGNVVGQAVTDEVNGLYKNVIGNVFGNLKV